MVEMCATVLERGMGRIAFGIHFSNTGQCCPKCCPEFPQKKDFHNRRDFQLNELYGVFLGKHNAHQPILKALRSSSIKMLV